MLVCISSGSSAVHTIDTSADALYFSAAHDDDDDVPNVGDLYGVLWIVLLFFSQERAGGRRSALFLSTRSHVA